jgi:3-oxoacyl-[acyl-carrier-protein] synthase II
MMEARSCLERSIAKLMVTGSSGTRINTTRLNYRGDLSIPKVSDPVSFSSRPHDRESVGVVGGEAAVSFVIESIDQAVARGAKPIARIASMVSRFVASQAMQKAERDITPSASAGRGSAKAIELSIRDAIKEAGLDIDQIGAVISQACGDPSIDLAEEQAINLCLPGVPVTAPVSSIGHTGAAVGAINVAVAALVVEHQQIPPTIGLNVADRNVSLVTKTTRIDKQAVIALSHTSEGSAIATVLVSA